MIKLCGVLERVIAVEKQTRKRRNVWIMCGIVSGGKGKKKILYQVVRESYLGSVFHAQDTVGQSGRHVPAEWTLEGDCGWTERSH